MHTRKAELGVITGGKDGTVCVWDSNMKIKNRIVIQELNLKIFNMCVVTVTENALGTIITVGTRGGDIVEMQGVKNRILMRGHSDGVLRGLTVHGKL